MSNGATTLSLLALNEVFEVAFFMELLFNITNDVLGYGPGCLAGLEKQYVTDTIEAIVHVSSVIARCHRRDIY